MKTSLHQSREARLWHLPTDGLRYTLSKFEIGHKKSLTIRRSGFDIQRLLSEGLRCATPSEQAQYYVDLLKEMYSSSGAEVVFSWDLRIILTVLFPEVVLKYRSLFKASRFEQSPSKYMSFSGLRPLVEKTRPLWCSTMRLGKSDVKPIYSFPSYWLYRM